MILDDIDNLIEETLSSTSKYSIAAIYGVGAGMLTDNAITKWAFEDAHKTITSIINPVGKGTLDSIKSGIEALDHENITWMTKILEYIPDAAIGGALVAIGGLVGWNILSKKIMNSKVVESFSRKASIFYRKNPNFDKEQEY
jgi:hypothetical protein